jgi:SAM-dependent methyltransferase
MSEAAVALFDSLAENYQQHFAEPHRRAYDELAWELVSTRLPDRPGTIVDVGCGTGRWARRLLGLGHRVIGIEPAPRMADRAEALTDTGRFTLVRSDLEHAELPAAGADLVVAMGSLQYSQDPAAALVRLAGWARPGASVCVLVDSLIGLVAELCRRGETDTALRQLSQRRGLWRIGDQQAGLTLFDAAELTAAFAAAGLSVDSRTGLLVGASLLGRTELIDELTRDFAGRLAIERRLSAQPELTDLGKQLLVIGRRGTSPRNWPPARPGSP